MNAPDLYLPVMAAWTYCILIGVACLVGGSFKPDIVYNTVSLFNLSLLLCSLAAFGSVRPGLLSRHPNPAGRGVQHGRWWVFCWAGWGGAEGVFQTPLCSLADS